MKQKVKIYKVLVVNSPVLPHRSMFTLVLASSWSHVADMLHLPVHALRGLGYVTSDTDEIALFTQSPETSIFGRTIHDHTWRQVA